MTVNEPEASYPRGWYRIALSTELRRDKPVGLRLLGRELVAFRDEHGRACVLDAHCPHLGAHLGDGRIVDGCIQCPFHGWRFDGAGRCVAIPFASRIPSRATTRAWQVEEIDGVVFIWYHPAGAEPDFAVPSAPEVAAGWSHPLPFRRRLRARLVDVKENIADFAHFPELHNAGALGFRRPPRLVWRRSDEAHFHMEVESETKLFGAPIVSRIRFDLTGPGLEEARVLHPTKLLLRFVTTPIDPEWLDFMVLVYVPPSPLPGLQRLLRRFFQLRVAREVDQDTRIWQRKAFRPRPVLSEADGPIVALRTWLSQFDVGQTSPASEHRIRLPRLG